MSGAKRQVDVVKKAYAGIPQDIRKNMAVSMPDMLANMLFEEADKECKKQGIPMYPIQVILLHHLLTAASK